MNSDFLDTVQYTPASIGDYEAVWGEGFISPGGAEKAREMLGSLGLPRGACLLDVCCGVGGSAFLMAEELGWRVVGVDLSRNMVEVARRRCRERGLEGQVQISQGDALALKFEGEFDAVYSRDAFLHIHDKPVLLEGLFRSLKPGGKLIFTDYCCGERPWSDSFRDYVEEREYCLHTVYDYVSLLREAGFEEVIGEDLTGEFIGTLKDDLRRIAEKEAQQALKGPWEAKLQRSLAGEQRWAIFAAQRPGV